MIEPAAIRKSDYLSELADKNLKYWKRKLDGAPKQIEFQTDFPRSAERQHNTACYKFSIPKNSRNALSLISYEAEASFSVLLFSAFNVLLFRYTNQTDLVIGYPTIEYTKDDGILDEALGKIVPMRTDLSENPAFSELLQRVSRLYDEAIEHKDLPGFLIEDELSLKENAAQNLYQAIFAFRNSSSPGAEVFSTTAAISSKQYAGMDLILSIVNTPEGSEAVFEYNSQIFEEETISRMAGHFQILLNEIILNPRQNIGQIAILDETERFKLLFDWNDTQASFPEEKCLHELFEEQANRTPDAIAVEIYGANNASYTKKRQLTYSELNKRANQVAHYLQSLGAGPETVVGIYMKRSLDMAVALLGILKAGAAYLPLDPGYPKERLNYIFKDSGITILLSQYKLINKLPTHDLRVVCLDGEWDTISQHKESTSISKVTPYNICYIIYTSGSTGLPKGTLIIHRGVVNYLSWCIKAYKVAEGNGSPVNSSLAFDATVTSFLSPLLAGKKVFLLPEEGEIEALVEVLQAKNKFSLIKITPAHLEILGNLLPAANSEGQANALVIGGEALTGKSLGFWRKHAPSAMLINEYGPTETVVGCCIYDIPKDKPLTHEIPIGRPIANTQIYILDRFMQPVPIGVAGEIYIGGAGVARGYLNRPELTAERFILNPFIAGEHLRIYKTGDIARYLKDGNIVYLGRSDQQLKIRGYRIELGEIEHALQQCEAVSQGVVLGKDDKEEGKRLVAYYIPDQKAVKAKERELQYQWVANWKEIYETEYGQTEDDNNVDPEFNLVGWNDSFTGSPIPAPEMKEWLDDIVDVVLSGEPDNVLEIGCGTGLIYYQLAGKVQKYIGSDLSTSSINQIKKRISQKARNYGETELFTAPAHEVRLQEAQEVDTVLLNSMVQYFPGEDYMNEVMDNCMSLIKKKGRIIIGDVRDNRLLELFKTRLKIGKSQNALEIKKFKWGLEQDVINEEELCFSPGYFYRLKDRYPEISHVEIQWKKGEYINELSLYRFTVVIYAGIDKPQADLSWQSWDEIKNRKHTFFENGSNTLAIKDVPNPRLWKEQLIKQGLDNSTFKTVGDLVLAIETEGRETIEVNRLINLAESKGYKHRFFIHEDPLRINLLFEIIPSHDFIRLPAEEKLYNDKPKTNTPLFTDIGFMLQKDIRKQLLNTLPAYMIPSDIIALRNIPLTTNGKIDQEALPAPNQERTDSKKVFVGARNKLENELAKLFGKALGLQKISMHDDFFELGLNSMQAYRLFAQIKKITGKQLPLSVLIKAPNIQKLAVYLKGKEASLPWSSLVPIQPKGSQMPLYLIHAGAGTVLFYRELSQHLGEDQPVYGLQPMGLDGRQNFHRSIEEMAKHYVHEIQVANPTGPYLLGGYCFGAVVAFEMAQQLINDHFKVALIANFNGVSPVYDDNLSSNSNTETGIDADQIKSTAEVEKIIVQNKPAQKNVKGKIISFLKKIRRTVWFIWRPALYLKYIAFLMFLYRCYQSLGLSAPQKLRKYYFLLSNSDMVKVYKPKPYPGSMVIFRSPGIYPDPHLGWSDFIDGEITTCDVPGHHIDRRQILNEPFVELTARELKAQIEKITADA